MSNQLKVTIKNKTNAIRLLPWLPKGGRCIAPNSSIELDYEPWSSLQDKNKNAMILAMKTGDIALTLHVMGLDGKQHDIDYDPCMTGKGLVLSKPMQPDIRPQVQATTNTAVDERSHIIHTTGISQEDLPEFIQTQVTPPDTSGKVEGQGSGFSKETPGIRGTVVDNSNADYLVAKKKEEEVVEKPKPERDYRSEFNELVSQKKWTEALELLIEQFGKDKVTFSARTIMTLKDYDEIVTRKINQ